MKGEINTINQLCPIGSYYNATYIYSGTSKDKLENCKSPSEVGMNSNSTIGCCTRCLQKKTTIAAGRLEYCDVCVNNYYKRGRGALSNVGQVSSYLYFFLHICGVYTYS